jgi:hypothetical protein
MSQEVALTPYLHVRVLKNQSMYIFRCPGCSELPDYFGPPVHVYYTEMGDRGWQFNGNNELPSFTPSLKNTYHDGRVCHLFITDGKIHYCDDCWHSLKGKTVDMPIMSYKSEE